MVEQLTWMFWRLNDTMQAGWRAHIIFAAIAAALCSIESWALGSLSWIYGYGSGLETIPAYLALAADDRNFSLWAPFVAGGIDRLAFWGNADPISVEMLLFSLLPVWLANGLHRFLQYFVAILFAARVGKEQLGLNWRWSAYLGLLHGCFAYQTVGALFTIAGVPLLLWIIDRLTLPGRSWMLALAAGLGFSLFTTFTFSDPYILLFATMWLIIVLRRYTAHAAWQFAVFAITLLVADSPQFFAIASNAAFSHRAGWPSEEITFSLDGLFYRQLQFDIFAQDHWLALITMNLPGVAFLGGVPLALYAMWRDKRDPVPLVFFRVFAIWAILSQKWLWVSIQAAVGLIFPFVAGVYMGRFFQIPAGFIIAAGLALVSRLVWDRLQNGMARHAAVTVAVGLAAFMIIWPKVHLFYPLGVDGWGERNYQIKALDEIRKRETVPFRVASVLPLQPSYAYAQGLEAADGWANLFPAAYRDVWYRALAPLFAEIPFTRRIFGVDTGRPEDNFIFLGADLIQSGVGALPGEDVTAALKSGFDFDRRFNLGVLRLLNIKYLLSEYPLKGAGIELVHAPEVWPDFPQSRSRNTGLVQEPRAPQSEQIGMLSKLMRPISDMAASWHRHMRGKDIFIYAVRDPVPRFRLVDSVAVESNAKAVLDRVAQGNPNQAAIESADAHSLGEQTQFVGGNVSIVQYTPDEIVLDVDHSGSGFLVIANTWSPYWRAEIDGKSTPLIRTNHAQFGLLVGSGERRVRLYYAPPYSWAWLTGRK
jgi:hypothetical protein